MTEKELLQKLDSRLDDLTTEVAQIKNEIVGLNNAGGILGRVESLETTVQSIPSLIKDNFNVHVKDHHRTPFKDGMAFGAILIAALSLIFSIGTFAIKDDTPRHEIVNPQGGIK